MAAPTSSPLQILVQPKTASLFDQVRVLLVTDLDCMLNVVQQGLDVSFDFNQFEIHIAIRTDDIADVAMQTHGGRRGAGTRLDSRNPNQRVIPPWGDHHRGLPHAQTRPVGRPVEGMPLLHFLQLRVLHYFVQIVLIVLGHPRARVVLKVQPSHVVDGSFQAFCQFLAILYGEIEIMNFVELPKHSTEVVAVYRVPSIRQCCSELIELPVGFGFVENAFACVHEKILLLNVLNMIVCL